MIHVLTEQNTIASHFIAELRSADMQQDRMRFRHNMERLGEVFAYEISKTLPYVAAEIETPLGTAETALLNDLPVLVAIIRSGLPMHQGLLNVFDQAECGFIAAYRKAKKSGDFEIHSEYINTPNLHGKNVIITDPMLATGRTMVLVCKELLDAFQVQTLHIATAIASEEGVAHVRAFVPKAQLWIGAIDAELTGKSYIVPGLGDAGDLAYGAKE